MSKKPQPKRIFRRTNTYGIYALSIVITSVVVYSLLELSRVCAVP